MRNLAAAALVIAITLATATSAFAATKPAAPNAKAKASGHKNSMVVKNVTWNLSRDLGPLKVAVRINEVGSITRTASSSAFSQSVTMSYPVGSAQVAVTDAINRSQSVAVALGKSHAFQFQVSEAARTHAVSASAAFNFKV